MKHLIHIVHILDRLKIGIKILGVEIAQELGSLREVILPEPLTVEILRACKSKNEGERLVALVVLDLSCCNRGFNVLGGNLVLVSDI